MIALRKIMVPKLWEGCLARGFKLTNLPALMLAEFMPSREEKDHFSVYVVPNVDEAPKVAAAMAMVAGKGAERTLFAMAEVGELEKSGVELKRTSGDTLVASIDVLHHNLLVPDHATLTKVTRLFAKQDPLIEEAADVRQAALSLAAAGEYDFAALASGRSKHAQERICQSTLTLVSGRYLIVSPAAA